MEQITTEEALTAIRVRDALQSRNYTCDTHTAMGIWHNYSRIFHETNWLPVPGTADEILALIHPYILPHAS